MKSFLEVCENTRQKLDRELQENEIDFLYWVYERYENEQKNKKELIDLS